MKELNIAEVKKTSFKKGDVLVVKSPDLLTNACYTSLISRMKDLLPEGVGVLVLDNGKDIAILEKEGD